MPEAFGLPAPCFSRSMVELVGVANSMASSLGSKEENIRSSLAVHILKQKKESYIYIYAFRKRFYPRPDICVHNP